MKAVVTILLAAALLAAAPASLRAQGLLGIGPKSDYRENIPLTLNVTTLGGYDSIRYSSPGSADVDSAFIEGGLGLVYAQSDRITKITTGADFSTIYYFDDVGLDKQTYYNARGTFNIQHQFSRRFSLSDNFYAAYEIEPDFNIGVSNARRSGQYFYGYNNFAVSYAWSDRVASTTGYNVSGIKYQERSVGQFEDRISHVLSQQISYKLSRRTSLTAEYRFEKATYNNFPASATAADCELCVGASLAPGSTTKLIRPDYTAHYLLVGVDQAWSPTLNASARVGVEFYDSDRINDTAPYLEAAINYALSRRSTLRWYHQLGYDGSQLGDFDARYSYRTGVVASHQFSERLTGNAGIHYVYSDYKASDTAPSANENELNASLGVSYKITKNLAVQANYAFTTISSDIAFNEYDRHYTTVGLNASF